jgi:hypothetical protein
MGDITVRKNNLINTILCKQSRKFLLGVDRYPLRVVRSSKFWRIDSIGNERDLSGCESDHLIMGPIPEKGVEIVEISASGPEDEHPNRFIL